MKFGILLFTILVTTPVMSLFGQQQSSFDRALRYMESHREEWGLESSDLNDLVVSDQYISSHNGVQHFYFKQRYRGIPIFNAIGSVHIRPDGVVAIANQSFEARLAERVTALRSVSTPDRVMNKLIARSYPGAKIKPRLIKKESALQARFSGGDISTHPIVLEQQYLPMPDGELRLTWGTTIVEKEGGEAWLIHIDALTGEPIQQQSLVTTCQFEHYEDDHCAINDLHTTTSFKPIAKTLLELGDGARYRVFPVPVESPIHGERSLVIDPADPIASPFGWHDTNGEPGPEHFITRGNNAHTYLDIIPDNLPDEISPANGGSLLLFDFPLDLNNTPDTYEEAVMTQLFYMNNVMHDFTYHYGFDEVAGNFQENNYGRGGRSADYVNVEAQDGSGINNANFLTLPDGENSRMQMFLWAGSRNNRVEVNSPAITENNRFRFGTADFGPILRSERSGPIVPVLSEDFDNNSGCGILFNANQLEGAIALVRRGDCPFEAKVKNAEAAGAIAVIITNTEDDIIAAGGVDTIPDPLIPTVTLSLSDGQVIRDALTQGPVTATLEAPEFLDSGFDNGVIAHEYAHGISNRLTGGPSEAFCLFNNEQMGEGWSDFFALVTTVRPDDTGELPRGIGNYVTGRDVRGRGIRRQPYSTSFELNNQTYDDVIGTTAPHPLGEIWAATLWDLYWALTTEYGWDPDLYTGTGGNNLAIQLVMDGMKLQDCQPGFIDGRDAIIAADQINNNGANECLIWEVFSRRGLGWFAEQGSSGTRNDNIEDFSLPPSCIQALKITKTSTPNIEAGDTFQVTINLINEKHESATEIVVTDEIPEGATPIPSSFSGGEEVSLEGRVLVWKVGDLPSRTTTQLRYALVSSPELISRRLFSDDMESGAGGWRLRSIKGQEGWRQSTTQARSGEHSWFVPNTNTEQDQSLQLLQSVPLTMGKPVLRFHHAFDIEPGLDGGVVEAATDGGFNWSPINEDAFIRSGYTGRLAIGTLDNQKRKAFWGSQPNFSASYIDLSSFLGGSFNMRFRLGARENENQGATNGRGWYIDDVTLFDMIHYQSEACVQSAEGDQACTINTNGGTIVEPQERTTNTLEPLASNQNIQLFPNPALGQVNIQLDQLPVHDYTMELVSIEGHILRKEVRRDQHIEWNITELPAGMYLVKITSGSDQWTQKLIIK